MFKIINHIYLAKITQKPIVNKPKIEAKVTTNILNNVIIYKWNKIINKYKWTLCSTSINYVINKLKCK